MKKKLVSLLLCIVLLLSFTMASCSTVPAEEEEEGEEEAVRYPMTLVWAMICDEVPSEETQASVEKAVNKITESKFMTHIELEYYETSEYSTKVEEKLVQCEAEHKRMEAANRAWKKFVKANRIVKNEDGSTYRVETERLYEMFWESYPDYEKYVQPEETTDENYVETEAETVLNDWGIGVLAYPEATEYQIDIVYVSGYDNYIRYIDNEWLASLDENLNEKSKVLSDKIFSAFLTAAETMSGTYAIPNNNVVGDYTYLLLHKGLIEKYFYIADNITGLTTSLCQDFLYDVANSESENFVPLLDNEATKKPQNIKFWNLNYTEDESGSITSQSHSNAYSVLGATYSKVVTQKRGTNCVYQCMLLLDDDGYASQLKTLKKYECEGYYGAGANETRPFAAGVVVGDAGDLVPKYGEDYHMIVLDYPRGTENDLFDHMWGVASYCEDLNRAMEIVTYLNSNADFRNLIQYGEKGVNYTIDAETGMLKRLNRDYMMDINKTGNVFLAYPEEGMSPNAWEYGKLQNQNALVDLLVGFSLSDLEMYQLNEQGLKAVKKWTEITEADLKLCATVADLECYLSGFVLEKGTDLSTLTVIQKRLLELNGITESPTVAKQVKGVLGVMKADESLMLMTDSTYDPKDPYAGDTTGGTKNQEHYGPGGSLHSVYREWAELMKFLIVE
ncbi:MAG: hypothetical protein IKC26_06305 [Clostridia bacterium]|nr:hypothetical protein [Clostridia bacterium]